MKIIIIFNNLKLSKIYTNFIFYVNFMLDNFYINCIREILN